MNIEEIDIVEDVDVKEVGMIEKVRSKVGHTILRMILFTAVLMGSTFCGHAFSQDYTSPIDPPEELKTIMGRRFEESRIHIRPDTDSTREQTPSPSLLVPLFNYLVKTKGRIPIVSGGRGKIQVELGLSGYVGVKWLF